MTDESKKRTETAVFGGGCFWCTEAVFKRLAGVESVAPGYAGGQAVDPTYDEVSTGQTGHAEVIRIEFDPDRISYRDLLTVFFATHDPTTPNRQGHDVGTQYRSIVLYTSEDQKTAAEQAIKEIDRTAETGGRVVTEVRPLERFFPAEGYHHDYYEKNRGKPYCIAVINPKLKRVKQRFAELLKENADK